MHKCAGLFGVKFFTLQILCTMLKIMMSVIGVGTLKRMRLSFVLKQRCVFDAFMLILHVESA